MSEINQNISNSIIKNLGYINSTASDEVNNKQAVNIDLSSKDTFAGYSPLSYNDLDEEEFELLKKELERKTQELKQNLKDKQTSRGWASSFGNAVISLFGYGDKKTQNQLLNYKALLKNIETDPSSIIEAYKEIEGAQLNQLYLKALKTSAEISNSLNSNEKEMVLLELSEQLKRTQTSFKDAKKSNGWISRAWDKFKNWTGVGASSNKVQAQIENLKEQIQKAKTNEADLAEIYKNITGEDLSIDSLMALLDNKEGPENISQAEILLNNYKKGQSMVSDIAADVISGIAAITLSAAAPLTGGASLLLAGGVGAIFKPIIKASDCIGNKKSYSLKDGIYDIPTGFVNGLMGPLTNGLGGAAGTGIAKAFGLEALENTAKTAAGQAIKQTGKEVAEQTAKQTGKSFLTRILAKQGTRYVLKEGTEATFKTTAGKFLAYGVDMMVDGALSGASDNAARAAAQGRFEDIASETISGLIGGAIMAPFIGGGMRLATKAGSTLLNKVNNKITISNLLPDGSATKFSQGDTGDCALLSMMDGFLGNKNISGQLRSSISTDANGDYLVKIGSRAVKVTKDSLSDEILSDTTGIRLFEQAYKQIAGSDSLNGGFADVVANKFGLSSIHINSDSIIDDVLEQISKELDSNNAILSLGMKVDANGVVDESGIIQHYFSIKDIDLPSKTINVVDTYDTSKTLQLSFSDIKTAGVSIDGGTIKPSTLPNSPRNANDILFYGNATPNNSAVTTELDNLQDILEMSNSKFKKLKHALNSSEIGSVREEGAYRITKLKDNAYEILNKNHAAMQANLSPLEMLDAIETSTITEELQQKLRILYSAGEINDKQLATIYDALKRKNLIYEEGRALESAIHDYKTKSYRLYNRVLRGEAIDDIIASDSTRNQTIGTINSKIKYLSDYLKGFEYGAGLELYRTDTYDILDNIRLNSGPYKGCVLSDLLKKGVDGEIDIAEVQKALKTQTIPQKSFLSTSLLELGADECNRMDRKIVWNFTTGPKVNGSYLDVYTEKLGKEYEFLIDRNSNINITNLNFKDGRWYIDATVSN